MPVTSIPRNHLFCYTGYVPATSDLVRLDVCGDPADLIVRFLNTLDVEEGTDAIDTLDGWASWLSAEGLDGCFGPQDPGALERARELRGDLRALAGGEQHARLLNDAIPAEFTAHAQLDPRPP